jgi:hypothetical protein
MQASQARRPRHGAWAPSQRALPAPSRSTHVKPGRLGRALTFAHTVSDIDAPSFCLLPSFQDAKTPSRDIYALGRGVGQPPQSLVLSVTNLRPADEGTDGAPPRREKSRLQRAVLSPSLSAALTRARTQFLLSGAPHAGGRDGSMLSMPAVPVLRPRAGSRVAGDAAQHAGLYHSAGVGGMAVSPGTLAGEGGLAVSSSSQHRPLLPAAPVSANMGETALGPEPRTYVGGLRQPGARLRGSRPCDSVPRPQRRGTAKKERKKDLRPLPVLYFLSYRGAAPGSALRRDAGAVRARGGTGEGVEGDGPAAVPLAACDDVPRPASPATRQRRS